MNPEIKPYVKVILIQPNTAYHLFIGKFISIMSNDNVWIRRIFNTSLKSNLQVKVTPCSESSQDISIRK